MKDASRAEEGVRVGCWELEGMEERGEGLLAREKGGVKTGVEKAGVVIIVELIGSVVDRQDVGGEESCVGKMFWEVVKRGGGGGLVCWIPGLCSLPRDGQSFTSDYVIHHV